MEIKRCSTRFDIVRRNDSRLGKPKSAVEASSYISRSILESERTGEKHYPKPHEDLVFQTVMLPKNAPEEYRDRQVLWNAVEQNEKHCRAQLARSMRASLPNEWTYEVAESFVQDYIKRNFVDEGMCADVAIHDSVNPDGQRNLHFHLLLTMTPIMEDGSWGKRQEKRHKLDKNGEWKKKANGKWDYENVQLTDWNDKGKARQWRSDLVESINAMNEKLSIDSRWEHRSNKELGMEELPTVHLGQVATVLERKGIHTDRGNLNRQITMLNNAIRHARAGYEVAKKTYDELLAKPMVAIKKAKNEITELLDNVVARYGRLKLPVMSNKYMRFITGRDKLQEKEVAEDFIEKSGVTTFDELRDYIKSGDVVFENLNQQIATKQKQSEKLEQKINSYKLYKPYMEAHKISKSLTGREKRKYDRENAYLLDGYSEQYRAFHSLLEEGEKITPKAWTKEYQTTLSEIHNLLVERAKRSYDLSRAEVIRFNKHDLERVMENESHRRGHSQYRNKNKESL